MKKLTLRYMLLLGAVTLFSASASATLNVSYQFNGNGNWSIDAVGGNNTPVGNLQGFVPLGATVQRAFLYSSTLGGPVPTVNFDGTVYSGAQFTALGFVGGLQAFRTDVTAQVAAKVGGGNALPFTFGVLSESPNTSIDGEVLVIVYSSPFELSRTIAVLDGFSSQSGDSTSINLASPLTAAQLADPNFEAQLSLGIGFSAGGANGQSSEVEVNGMRLTSAAGGFDDGQLENGALITAGGLGDSLANPANPNSTTSADDELYSLTSFLSAGQTQIMISTRNPSFDDNIFFAGINITAVGGVNQPPPTPPPSNGVPEGGSTFLLFALSIGGVMAVRAKLQTA